MLKEKIVIIEERFSNEIKMSDYYKLELTNIKESMLYHSDTETIKHRLDLVEEELILLKGKNQKAKLTGQK